MNRLLIAAAVLVACSGLSYLKGRSDGRAITKGEVVGDMIANNKEWNDALSDAERLDAYDRCIAVGGLPNDCNVLLRNKSPTTGQ